jgi:hypothetical protein
MPNNKTEYQKIKELLHNSGWVEQSCGEIYHNGAFGTNFVNRMCTETITILYDTFPDDESINKIVGDE